MLSLALWFANTAVGRYLIAGATAVAIVGLAIARIFAKGQAYERSKNKEKQLIQLDNARKASAEVDKLSRADRSEYVSKWVRDE